MCGVCSTVVVSFKGVVEGNVVVTSGSGFSTCRGVVVTVEIPPWSVRRKEKSERKNKRIATGYEHAGPSPSFAFPLCSVDVGRKASFVMVERKMYQTIKDLANASFGPVSTRSLN